MKYILFTAALAAGVPVMAGLSAISVRIKHLLFALLLVTFMLGDALSINIMSMENYRGPVRGYEVTAADLISLALIIGMLLRSGSALVMRPPLFWPLLGFFLFSIYNVSQSQYPLYGWFAVWQLLRAGLLYWCTVNFFATEPEGDGALKAFMRGITASGLIFLVITFKQKYLDGIYRTPAFFDHSNTVPSFALALLGSLLVWSILENRLSIPAHVLSLTAALGLVFAVMGTSSRTGMVTGGGAVAASVVLINISRRGQRIPRSGRIRFATAFLAAAMVVGGLFVIDTVIDRFLNAPESSETARGEFETAAVMMADDYPWGVGLNQYSEVLTLQKEYREHFKVMRNEEQGGVAHHIYLLTAAEMGWAGMWFFILILILAVAPLVIYGFPMRTIEQRLLLATAMGLAIICLIGLYEWVIRQTPVLYQMTVTAGLGQALVLRVREQKRSEKDRLSDLSLSAEAAV
jgi:hypothetical protein